MTSVLSAIEMTLNNLCRNADVPMEGSWYGACNAKELDAWNYFVFNRDRTVKSSNKLDWQTFYKINVIHEDYIPDGYINQVIETLEDTEGVKIRATSEPVDYNYVFKNKTDVVVEIATITVFHPEKRVM